jgi:preprotein translocase subunit Sec63
MTLVAAPRSPPAMPAVATPAASCDAEPVIVEDGGHMVPDPDHYEVLGVARSATIDDIRSAYRRLARDLHPDVAVHRDDARLVRVTDAWFVLRDHARRARYDAAIDAAAGYPRGHDLGSVPAAMAEPFVPHRSAALLRLLMATLVLGSMALLLLIAFLGFSQGAGT